MALLSEGVGEVLASLGSGKTGEEQNLFSLIDEATRKMVTLSVYNNGKQTNSNKYLNSVRE
jgi:hypothetical protein